MMHSDLSKSEQILHTKMCLIETKPDSIVSDQDPNMNDPKAELISVINELCQNDLAPKLDILNKLI